MIIHFSLPNLYEFHKINQFLIKIQHTDINKFKYGKNINFYNLKGSFPYNSWNGGLNYNYGDIVLLKDLKEFFLYNHNIALRYDFSNVLLEERDFYDIMSNQILAQGNNGANFIEVTNLDLIEYIVTNYPAYQNFVISNKFFINQEMNVDNFTTLANLDLIKLITLPRITNNNFDLLRDLPKKQKIEIIINPLCICDSYNTCIVQENFNQLHYNEYSVIGRCNHRCENVIEPISIEEIQSKYIPLGINHFIFDYPSLIQQPITDTLAFYIRYFIIPEYQLELYQEGVKFLQND